jgi:hypothetical protein
MSAYVSTTDWGTIRTTLKGEGIDDVNADLIIALLQQAEQHNPSISPRILELADALKLLSLKDLQRLNAALVNIAQTIGAPSRSISVTEQNVKWWREFTTYLFGAGVAIAVINSFVPIQFGLIAKTVFATGFQAAQVFFRAFSGTSGPAAAAAAAATEAAGPSMVAGPSMAALEAIGGILYTVSVAALRTCAGIVTSAVGAVASGACQLMTKPNAEKVADLAVQSAAIAGITAGIDKGWDFTVKLNRGEFDAAIAAVINSGIFDEAENAVINAILEAAYDIKAANDKIGVKMSDAPAWSKRFIPHDRQLDVDIMNIIRGNFTESLANLGETSSLGTHAEIMQNLFALDKEPPDPVAIIRLKETYGIKILILYMLLSQKGKRARPGFGKNKNSSSQPVGEAEKWVELPAKSDSMFASVGRPGLNPYIVDYNLKTKILHDAGWRQEESFDYIDEFQGSMSDCMKQVLGRLYDESRPSQGNIFTAISRMNLTEDQQNRIFDYMLGRCSTMTGTDPEEDKATIDDIAVEVRTMIHPQPSVMAAALAVKMDTVSPAVKMAAVPAVKATGPFAGIEKTSAFSSKGSAAARNPRATRFKNLGPQEVDTSTASTSTENAPTENDTKKGKVSETGTGTGTPGTLLTSGEPVRKHEKRQGPGPGPGPGLGGRKSRQHKKRKSTLKRRRIRRRRLTRKGRKRRYTKRR